MVRCVGLHSLKAGVNFILVGNIFMKTKASSLRSSNLCLPVPVNQATGVRPGNAHATIACASAVRVVFAEGNHRRVQLICAIWWGKTMFIDSSNMKLRHILHAFFKYHFLEIHFLFFNCG